MEEDKQMVVVLEGVRVDMKAARRIRCFALGDTTMDTESWAGG
jgi:hypothetical protein